MELILGAIVAIALFWLLISDLLKPPVKKPPRTPEQELADAVRKVARGSDLLKPPVKNSGRTPEQELADAVRKVARGDEKGKE